MINYYVPHEDAAQNCETFDAITRRFPQVQFFQPAPDKAPWHVQAIIETDGEPIIVNFWPHRLKGQRQPLRSVEGKLAIIGIIEGALEEADEDNSFDVIED